MNQPPKHIGDSIEWNRVVIYFDKLPIGEHLYFQIVNFLKARNKEYNDRKRHSWYVEFVAYFEKGNAKLHIAQEDYAIMTLPYRAFERALQFNDLKMKKERRKILSNENLYIEIEKISRMGFDIHDMKAVPENDEMTQRAGELLYDS